MGSASNDRIVAKILGKLTKIVDSQECLMAADVLNRMPPVERLEAAKLFLRHALADNGSFQEWLLVMMLKSIVGEPDEELEEELTRLTKALIIYLGPRLRF